MIKLLSSQELVALLGIAHRQIRIKYAQKQKKSKQSKSLTTSPKTLGDWIRVKRMEKNLTPGLLATKMGIATTLVRAWEDDSKRPDSSQFQALANCLGISAGDYVPLSPSR